MSSSSAFATDSCWTNQISSLSLTFLIWKMEDVAETMLWVPPAHMQKTTVPLASRGHHVTEFWLHNMGHFQPWPKSAPRVILHLPQRSPEVSEMVQSLTLGEAQILKFTTWRRFANQELPDQTLCKMRTNSYSVKPLRIWNFYSN